MILTSHTKKDNEITSKIYSHFNAKLFINKKKNTRRFHQFEFLRRALYKV